MRVVANGFCSTWLVRLREFARCTTIQVEGVRGCDKICTSKINWTQDSCSSVDVTRRRKVGNVENWVTSGERSSHIGAQWCIASTTRIFISKARLINIAALSIFEGTSDEIRISSTSLYEMLREYWFHWSFGTRKQSYPYASNSWPNTTDMSANSTFLERMLEHNLLVILRRDCVRAISCNLRWLRYLQHHSHPLSYSNSTLLQGLHGESLSDHLWALIATLPWRDFYSYF